MHVRQGTRFTVRIPRALVFVVSLVCSMLCIGLLAGHIPRSMATVPEEGTSTLSWATSSRVYYGSYNTPVFTASDQEGRATFAYCVDPTTRPPAAATYATMPLSNLCSTVDEVRAALWFGYGGPGFDSSMWPETWIDGAAMDAGKYYAATHLILSYAVTHELGYTYYNAGSEFIAYAAETFMGIDLCGQTVNASATLFQMFNRAGEVPEDFVCYALDCGEWDYTQYIVTADYYEVEVPPGWLTIQKTSSMYEMTAGNRQYSLEGARYGVYDDEQCTSLIAEISTDAAGYGLSGDLAEGVYWVKELLAPPGYSLDQSVYSVTVRSEQTTALSLTDEPLHASLSCVAQKVDGQTGAVAQGSATLAGAEFTVRYYAGVYNEENLPEQATRTWVFSSNEEGLVLFDQAHLVSGDALYRDASGNVVLPLGTIAVQETKAPPGYLLSDTEVRLYKATTDKGADVVFEFQAPSIADEVVRGGIAVRKVDADTGSSAAQGNATLQGAVFEVVSLNEKPVVVDGMSYGYGETLFTLTTDEGGNASTAQDALPYGTYGLREVQAPQGYAVNGEVQTVFVSQNAVVQEAVVFSDAVVRGGISVGKVDAETDGGAAQGSATLAGARFSITNASVASVVVGGVSYAPGEVVATIETDSDGFASTAIDALPFGDYRVEEVAAPEGYLLDEAEGRTVTVSEGGVVVSMGDAYADHVVRGGLELRKVDADTGDDIAQGDASLEGAEFAVVSLNDAPVIVGGQTYRRNDVVLTLTTDAYGRAQTDGLPLPYGTYGVQEVAAPEGYELSDAEMRVVNVDEAAVVSCGAFTDSVERGGVSVRKVDAESGSGVPQGSSTLEGARFAVTNASASWVVVDGVTYQPGEVVTVIETGADGVASTSLDLLPFGTYSIEEVAAPRGYLLSGGQIQTVSVTEGGVVVMAEKPVTDQVVRGGIQLQKVDAETGLPVASASATLVGACFAVTNASAGSVLVNGVWYSPGEVVATLSTDAYGYAATASDALPYGVYDVVETSAPEGYLIDAFVQRVYVSEQGTVVMCPVAFSDYVVRGDVSGIKVESDSGSPLAGVAFAVTSLTTGECHVLVTDENGVFSTAASQAPHTQCTNANDEVLTGSGSVGDEALLSSSNGVWFSGSAGMSTEADDGRGALPFDIYRFDELLTSTSYGHTLVSFTVAVRADGVEVDLGEIGDDVIELATVATVQETGLDEGPASDDAHIVDVVTYRGLEAGGLYELHGSLVYRASGEEVLDARGNPVQVVQAFVPEQSDGSVEVVFDVDASDLDTPSVVVTERLYWNGSEIAAHDDRFDNDQTVSFVEVSTTARGATSLAHEEQATSATTVVDTVEYAGLTPGRTYLMAGTLVNAESGEVVCDVKGRAVTCEAEFVPSRSNGAVELAFEFDATKLEGQTVVVYEELSRDGTRIAAHQDKDSADQSVSLLGLYTLALDARTGTHDVAVDEQVSVVDSVSYVGLTPGERYDIQGVLVDRDTAAVVVDAQGRPASVSLSFVPEEESGSVDVVFDLDASELLDRAAVATETLSHEGSVVAVHADLSSADQTIRWVQESIPIMGEKQHESLVWSVLAGFGLTVAGFGAFLVSRNRVTIF